MELRTIKTFIKVAELLNFSRAAAALGYTQSTVSVHISQLEEEFNVQLFERFGKNVRLTAEGTSFLAYAERINEAESEAENYMLHRSEPHGTLIIGAIDSISHSFLSSYLLQLHERYPRVSVVIRCASMEILFDLLDHNEVDLLCILSERVYNKNYIKFFEEKTPVNFVVRKQHPLLQKEAPTLDDLVQYDFILTEENVGYRRDLDVFFNMNEKSVTPFLEVGNSATILDFIKDCDAVSFLPDFAARRYVEDGLVEFFNIEGFCLEPWIQFLYLKRKWVTPPMRALIDLVRGKMGP